MLRSALRMGLHPPPQRAEQENGAPPADPSRSRPLVHVTALATAALFAYVLTSSYVGAERTFYFWDLAVFERLAARTALAFEQSFDEGMRVVVESTTQDYNALFALPLVPLFPDLGETRLAFVRGIALVYVVPFALAVGSVGAALIRGPRAAVFWSTTALVLLTPMSWVPAFSGYPDAGAALFVTLGVRVALTDPTLRRARTIVGVGVLLALAVLYRRHFLFAAPAVFAAVALSALDANATPPRTPARTAASLLSTTLRVLLTIAVGLLATFAIARPALRHLFSHDFYDLYAGYLHPPLGVAAYYFHLYGGLAWLGAAVGFVAGWRAGILHPRRALFVAGVGVTSLLLWVFLVRQLGEHYTLHLTPTVVLGLSALGWTLWTRGSRRSRVLLALAAPLYLAVNLFLGLSGLAVAWEGVPLRPALAANWPPEVREDYDQVLSLLEALRRLAQPEDPIFVAASSTTMNPDLLVRAELALHGRDARLQILNTPAVDSRDQYPVEPLLQAQIVVLVDPLQIHLAADQQKVVQLVHEMFTRRIELARDFEEIDGHYSLEEGATAVLFRRHRPTSLEVGLQGLRYMEDRFPTPPGSQPEWVVVSGRFPAWVSREPRGTSLTWHPALAAEPPPTVAVYLRAPPAQVHGTGTLQFVDDRCPGAALTFAHLAPDGVIREAAEVARSPGEAGAFEAIFPGRPGERLLLRLGTRPGQTSVDHCLLHVNGLTVR